MSNQKLHIIYCLISLNKYLHDDANISISYLSDIDKWGLHGNKVYGLKSDKRFMGFSC